MEEQRTKKKANCKQTQETERNIAHIIFFHCRDILNLSSQWVREKNARIGTELHLRDHEQGHSHDRFDSWTHVAYERIVFLLFLICRMLCWDLKDNIDVGMQVIAAKNKRKL